MRAEEMTMAEPEIPQTAPYGVELEPGDYFWCACGRSANQPFCDGSHKGTEFTPVKLTITEKKKVWLCGCKHSHDAPFCDGTHKQVAAG
jgi:CDGSH-type Zn-finger protein